MTSSNSYQKGGINPDLSELLKQLVTLYGVYRDQLDLTYNEDGTCETCHNCVWDRFIGWFNNEMTEGSKEWVQSVREEVGWKTQEDPTQEDPTEEGEETNIQS